MIDIVELGSFKLQLIDWIGRIRENWGPYLEEKAIIKKHNPDLIEEIDKAHREWEAAQDFFDYVTEPGLIDYAAYRLQAAESRYVYLLQQARKEGH